jgi:hypothetical protein
VIPGGYVALHDTMLMRGPREVAEARILKSSRFVNTGIADSITFGRIRRAREPEPEQFQRLRVMTLKRICNVAVQVHVPPPVKKWGSRVVATLQR